ncbi:hypothetical protein F5887DRAFT_1078907 [Amanita rubescens]|nr:hypothetical protein F5887DRAFT_1078907 [Amanita rubescens]
MRIIATRVRMSGDDDDDDNTDNVGDDVSTIPKDVSSDAQYSEPSSGQPTNAASPFSPTGEEVASRTTNGPFRSEIRVVGSNDSSILFLILILSGWEV